MHAAGKDVTLDEVAAFFHVKYPDADPKLYDIVFDNLRAADISNEAADSILNQFNRRKLALKLSEEAYKVGTGLSDVAALSQYFEKLQGKDDHKSQFESVEIDLDTVLDGAIRDQGLRWRLNCLNKAIGSLRVGDFGYIFARPETGKTAFLASEFSNMLRQSNRPLIWFNNEEQDKKVILRIYMSYFGVTLEKLMSNVPRYKAQFLEETKGRFKFFGIERCNKKDTDAILKEFTPELVVYDQLDKWKGFDADRDDLRLGTIYQWARENSKLYGAGIGVSQADGSAEGIKWLTMEHCANAKTSKQAEADWILGIGKTHNQAEEYVRFLSICKNKLLGDSDSRPELRHGRFETIIQPEIMRYKDVIDYN